MIEVEQGSIPLNRAVGLYKTPIKLDLAWPVVVVESQGMKTPRDDPRCFRAVREKRLHITVKGVLTLCDLPVSVVDEVITFEEIIRHFHRSSTAWRRRGCSACGEDLRDALTNARRIS